MDELVVGDSMRVVDLTSAMRGFTGLVLEVDERDSPEAPYWGNVICPGRYAPARCLFAREEIERVELPPESSRERGNRCKRPS